MTALLFLTFLSLSLTYISGFSLNSMQKVRVSRVGDLNMKIFDWKRRESLANVRIPDSWKQQKKGDKYEELVLTSATIFSNPGSRHRRRRIGRGYSAGQGGSCGKGMRGQKSRSGTHIRAGFEGGQTPLYRRLPKIGKARQGLKKTVYEIIKLEKLNSFENGSTINIEDCLEKKVVSKPNKGRKWYKVLGNGELAKEGLIVRAHAFSDSARTAIEGKGGQCVVMDRTRKGETVEAATAFRANLTAERKLKLIERRKLMTKKRLMSV